MDIIKRIYRYGIQYKGKALVASSLLILFICINLLMPLISRILVDDVIRGGNQALLPYLLLGILVAASAKGVMVYIRSVLFEQISQGCLYDLRNDLYTHLQHLPFAYYDDNRVGEIMSRMTGDLEGIRVFLVVGIPILLENAIYFICTAIILFSMNVELALLTLAVTPLLAFGAFRFDKRIRPAFGEIREQQAMLNTAAQENISGVRVVKAFAREQYETQKFEKENLLNQEKSINAAHVWAKYFPVMEFLSGLCVVTLIWYGGRMVAMDKISLGTLVAFNGYLWMLIMPMRMLGWMINVLAQAVSSGERVFNILDTGSSIKEKETPHAPDTFRGEVRFEDVFFYYREQQILFHLSFHIPAGKTFAILGPTGSGKTSIINLINRFYDATNGRILIDGVDIKEWKLSRLRTEVGLIMQETFLFSDTIEGNILYGNPGATHDEVIAAARMADAHGFIMEMPMGYDTIVGERGMGLSGGQKQRIAIARAIIKNPKILIMDDCTSAVDMETEYEIQKALKQVMANRTTIIIAHRISSVKHADEIIVLDKGRIMERGNHKQLMALKGQYYTMVRAQYKELDDMDFQRQVM